MRRRPRISRARLSIAERMGGRRTQEQSRRLKFVELLQDMEMRAQATEPLRPEPVPAAATRAGNLAVEQRQY